MYPRIDEWIAVRRKVDPDAVFASDMARRLELLLDGASTPWVTLRRFCCSAAPRRSGWRSASAICATPTPGSSGRPAQRAQARGRDRPLEAAGAKSVEYLDFDALDTVNHPHSSKGLGRWRCRRRDRGVRHPRRRRGTVAEPGQGRDECPDQLHRSGFGGRSDRREDAPQGFGQIIAMSSAAGERVRRSNFVYAPPRPDWTASTSTSGSVAGVRGSRPGDPARPGAHHHHPGTLEATGAKGRRSRSTPTTSPSSR